MSNFLEAARHTDRSERLPHQDAAWHWAWGRLSAEEQAEFLEMFRAAPPPGGIAFGVGPAPNWLAPAMTFIKHWEGLHLAAYPDPATGAEPYTIGYGCTYLRLLGRAVRQDDRILLLEAEDILRGDLRQHWGPELLALLPLAREWSGHRVAALLSWAFNVGLGAAKESTLRARLLDREDPVTVIREELPRWNKAAGKVMEGLANRRAAEVALFCRGELPAAPPPKPIEAKPPQAAAAVAKARGNPLVVPWYSQMDSRTDQARRMCFSSSCAMLVAFLKPGALSGANGDDQYLAVVNRYGDSTDPSAQIRALASYGIEAAFTRQASFQTLEEQIAKGYPVPCGYLHRGSIDRPSGSGHWLIVVGHTPTHLIVHDPFAEMDLVSGESAGTAARYCHYSRKNFGRRWMVEGDGSGWAVLVRRVIGS